MSKLLPVPSSPVYGLKSIVLNELPLFIGQLFAAINRLLASLISLPAVVLPELLYLISMEVGVQRYIGLAGRVLLCI